ncbi:MAG: SDR family oxidoreductase [Burkholderiaceae bacterium]
MNSAIYPSLADRRVVVTGGASGIGAAMVAAFVRQGAQVAFVDVAQQEGQTLVRQLADGARHRPLFLPCDLRDADTIADSFAFIEREIGPAQVLVNNAANDDRHAFDEVTPAYWDDRMAVNLRHQFFCAQAVAPGMRAVGDGVILNLGSISWHLAIANLSVYMSAKAAIEGMTRGLARELGAQGVRVNCIVPGDVRTPRQVALWQSPESEARIVATQCLQQRIEPEHVAAMALFLASDDAARCSGRAYYVDAGRFGM